MREATWANERKAIEYSGRPARSIKISCFYRYLMLVCSSIGRALLMSQSWMLIAGGATLSLLSLAGCTREILPTGAAPEPSRARGHRSERRAHSHDPSDASPSGLSGRLVVPDLAGHSGLGLRGPTRERDRVVLDATPAHRAVRGLPRPAGVPPGQARHRAAATSARRCGSAPRVPRGRIEPYGHASVEALPGTGLSGRGLRPGARDRVLAGSAGRLRHHRDPLAPDVARSPRRCARRL